MSREKAHQAWETCSGCHRHSIKRENFHINQIRLFWWNSTYHYHTSYANIYISVHQFIIHELHCITDRVKLVPLWSRNSCEVWTLPHCIAWWDSYCDHLAWELKIQRVPIFFIPLKFSTHLCVVQVEALSPRHGCSARVDSENEGLLASWGKNVNHIKSLSLFCEWWWCGYNN